MSRTLLLTAGLVAFLAVLPPAATADSSTQDEEMLRAAGVATDGPSLLAFLRRRSAGETDPEKLAALVARLSGDAASARKACGEILAIGPTVVPALRQATRDPDQAEAAALARRCLELLQRNSGVLSAAVIRRLAAEHPPESIATLLEFLPHADDDSVADEIHAALVAVVHETGKADATLLAALSDPAPLRRALAVEVLCQGGAAVDPATIRKLLQDPMPSVRLRAALALAQANDPKAVSTLVTLLDELPLSQAREGEEFLTELAGTQAPKATLEGDAETRRRCRDAWAAWWLESEKPELVDAFRKRTPTEENRLRGIKLIGQLGDDDFRVREKAVLELKKLGGVVVPLLRQAVARSTDVEVKQRAEGCLAEIEASKDTPLSTAYPRLVALRKPAGAVEAMLGYLPFADDDGLAEEVQKALNTVAGTADKVAPAVLRALEDAAPARRGAAATAICYLRAAEHYPAVRKLLKDPEPAVRVQTALALAGARERDVVPTLIDMVATLPAAQEALAEEYLLRLAQDRPPEGLVSGEGEAQKKRREAWSAWWSANGARVALVDRYPAPTGERHLGGTILVQPQNNQLTEVGPDNKVRWEMTGLLGPQDAQPLSGGRVLIAEFNGQRVTERNAKGDTLWQKVTTGTFPIGVQRLRNGNTFITCRNQILEVDRGGRELYTISRPANDVVAARRLRDGQIVCVTNQRQLLRLDTTGKELKNALIPMVMQNGVDVSADGHVVVCVTWMNKVTEYDADGKAVTERTVAQPMSACKLPGGHFLIGFQAWPARAVEIDRDGKVVMELPAKFQAYRVVRR
jgi:HEAT repeat protein